MSVWNKFRPMIGPSLVAAMVAAAVTTWQNGAFEPQACAEPRRITPQEPDQHFKSGGRLSEAVLQDMLNILKRIDERLERMEKSVEQIAATSRGAGQRIEGDEAQTATGAAPIQVRRPK